MIATPAPVASLNPLETAACIWEAVLSMKAYVRPAGVSDPCETPGETLARQIGATFEAIGTASVRMSAIEWTPLVDAAWIVADTDTTTGAGGQYGEAFDWEFVPDWIVANVDWSNPNAPAIRQPAPVQTVDMYGILFTATGDYDDSIMVDMLFDVLADAQRHAAQLADGMPGSSARVVHVSGDLPKD